VRAAAIPQRHRDTDRNLERADRLVRDAAALGRRADRAPETWTVLGTREHMQAGAQDARPARRSPGRARPRGVGIDP